MEGTWRGLATAFVLCALAVTTSGCGDDESSADSAAAIHTSAPERTFAPLVELAPDEPYRPMSARWFIERSALTIAEDRDCNDRMIAVGRTLPELHDDVTDWIYPKALGHGPHYYRNPYDENCEAVFDGRFYTDQLTRPHDPGNRVETARAAVGFQLDLVDGARGGPASLGATPVYVEQTEEGDAGVRLTYWMLFGMHAGDGPPHEGDWERVDVLLRRAGDDSYVPLAVQLRAGGGGAVPDELGERPWTAIDRVDGTHPLLAAASGSHALGPSPPGSCAGCVPWRTWRVLSDARDQLWYGFGGAWGEVGPTDATTGPLGPHGFFPSAADKIGDPNEG